MIKTFRKKAGLMQHEVAEKIGIAQSSYCNIEKGRRNPSLKTLRKLAELFHCTVDDLLSDEE